MIIHKSFLRISRTINKINPDFIISNMRISNIILGIALYLCKKSNSKIIFLEANTLTSLKDATFLKKIFYKFFINISYINSSLVIANSNDTKNDLKKILFIKKNIKVLGNPVVDVKDFNFCEINDSSF